MTYSLCVRGGSESHLITALLQQSSLTRNARMEAFCDGEWARKALVFRLRAKGAKSVCSQ